MATPSTKREKSPAAVSKPRSTTADPAHDASAVVNPVAELLRKLALGLLAALICCRFFWPSEYTSETDTGQGLIWVFSLLVTAFAWLASLLLDGRCRLRWSWADAAVYALILLVGLSSTRGAERRVAINLAWEWAGLGMAYALVRNVPRTRGESSVLAGVLVATAVAVSAYGLYQVNVEFPQLVRAYEKNPNAVLEKVGVDPNSPSRLVFEARLVGSNEPIATFALANSLAGFLVGPMVLVLAVALENLRNPKGRGSRWGALAAAAVPALILLTCLVLTKSRSAYLGLAVGVAYLAWRMRGKIASRQLLLAGGAFAAVVTLLVVAGLATRRLDLLVLTEATKSLRYRAEYWVGTWRVLTEEPGVLWHGLGPGNFAGGYLKHKLPWSSEEIRDPHNLFLDVWVTAGLWALLALLAAFVLGARDVFGRPRIGPEAMADANVEPAEAPANAPPERLTWLVAASALSWLLVVFFGRLNPFQEDVFNRWLILGLFWFGAVLAGMPLWRRLPIPAVGLGAAVLAIVINLLAAGGIGMSAVALGLWTLLALGLNLREDRPCGRLRIVGGRGISFLLALALAAIFGSFWGAVEPFWKSEALLTQGEADLHARPPRYDRGLAELDRASKADLYSVRPWIAWATGAYQQWITEGARIDDPKFWPVLKCLDGAVTRPRDRNNLEVAKLRGAIARDVLVRLGDKLQAVEIIQLKDAWRSASEHAAQLYPTSALVRAEYAQASASMGDLVTATREAQEALRLDAGMPHLDKKLPDPVRQRLQDQLPEWSRAQQAVQKSK